MVHIQHLWQHGEGAAAFVIVNDHHYRLGAYYVPPNINKSNHYI